MNCPNCGKETAKNQKFCPTCGAMISQAETKDETKNEAKGFDKNKLILTIVLLILVCGVFTYFILKKVGATEGVDNINSTQEVSYINCENYKDIDINGQNDFQFYQDYIQCAFDVNIKKLSLEYKIVEQDVYWDNLDFLLEHVYENSEKYGSGLPDPLPGKYNSLEKIYNAYDKYFIPYHLGKIALGQSYEGPDYMYGEGSFEKYYEVAKSSYDYFNKMTENEQIKIASNISNLTDFLLKNNKFKDTYYKDTYITDMLALIENANNNTAKETLKKAVIKLWKSQDEHEVDFYLITGSDIFADSEPQKSNDSDNLKKISQTLPKIDDFQEKYFSIIRRNDALLDIEGNEDSQRDIDELNALFSEVKNNIDKNNRYLQKYNEIENKYAINTGRNTLEMNDFASKNYAAIDGLLNEVYQEVKKTIPEDDFEQLTKSEIKWVKDVDSYYNVFQEKGFGTIRGIVKYGYEINMRSFRTLLLMLYL